MAIITKGSNLEKGNEVEFTLSITDLLAHASVSGDAYFSVQSNWDKVFINYTSAGYQKEILIFNNVDSGTSSAANFGVFSDARDVFEVHSIIIMDKQGGCLKIKRSDLVTADFDVDFGITSSGTAIQWESKLNYVPEADGGLTSTNTESFESGLIYSLTPIDTSSDFEIVYNVNGSMVGYNFLGYSNSYKSSWSGLYIDPDTNKGETLLLDNNKVTPYNGIRVINSVKIQKIGSDLFFTVNDVLVYQTNSNVLDSFIYPAVRILNGSFTVTSSSL